MQETWVQSLDWDDPLEKGRERLPWPGEFHGLYSPWRRKGSDMTERLLHLRSGSPHTALHWKYTVKTLSTNIQEQCFQP